MVKEFLLQKEVIENAPCAIIVEKEERKVVTYVDYFPRDGKRYKNHVYVAPVMVWEDSNLDEVADWVESRIQEMYAEIYSK